MSKQHILLFQLLCQFFACNGDNGKGLLLPPLRSFSEELNMKLGACGNAGLLQTDLYNTTLSSQYNLITAENACKFGSTQPSRGVFTWDGCDEVLAFAEANEMSFREHNLGAWGNQVPDWVTDGGFDEGELRGILEEQIQAVVGRYGDRAVAYDVVNEAISDDGEFGRTGDVFKENVWYPALKDYVDFSFQVAKEALGDGKAKLFYNDYNIGSMEGWSQGKSDRVYEMVKDMVGRGIPIDGVGLQMHVDSDYNLSIKSNMERYCDLGLIVHITELDISCKSENGCEWNDEAEERQGNLYATLLQECIDTTCCSNFETWGFTDSYSWMNTEDENAHPLPFDEEYKPKKAVEKMVQVLQDATTLK